MPQPIVSAQASDDTALIVFLARLERRITELERRAVGSGRSLAVAGYTITADGDTIVATRTSDGTTRILADFTPTPDTSAPAVASEGA